MLRLCKMEGPGLCSQALIMFSLQTESTLDKVECEVTGFGLIECRVGFPDAWDMASATYSMALPHPPTNDAAAPSSKSDFGGRQRNLLGRKLSGRPSLTRVYYERVRICEKVEMEVNLKRDGKRGRSGTPEVWKGGALNTAQHHPFLLHISLCKVIW